MNSTETTNDDEGKKSVNHVHSILMRSKPTQAIRVKQKTNAIDKIHLNVFSTSGTCSMFVFGNGTVNIQRESKWDLIHYRTKQKNKINNETHHSQKNCFVMSLALVCIVRLNTLSVGLWYWYWYNQLDGQMTWSIQKPRIQRGRNKCWFKSTNADDNKGSGSKSMNENQARSCTKTNRRRFRSHSMENTIGTSIHRTKRSKMVEQWKYSFCTLVTSM